MRHGAMVAAWALWMVMGACSGGGGAPDSGTQGKDAADGQATDVTQQETGTWDLPLDGFAEEMAACLDCTTDRCDAEVKSCQAHAECWGIWMCVMGQWCTSEATCYDECLGKFPGGQDDFQALGNCMDRECPEACAD